MIKMLYPYYYNTVDSNGNLKVKKNYLTLKEYIENVHFDPRIGLPC